MRVSHPLVYIIGISLFSLSSLGWLLLFHARSQHTSQAICTAAQSEQKNYTFRQPISLEEELIIQQLHRLQFPSDCDTAQIFIYPLGDHTGMGSELRGLASILSYSFSLNRTLIVDASRFIFLKDNPRCNRTWECFFHPLTNCSLHRVKDHPVRWQSSVEPTERVVKISQKDWWSARRGFKLFIPKRWHHMGGFWMYAQMYNYLLRPNAQTLEKVRKAQESIRFRTPCIFMHVRHGNKDQEAQLFPLYDYVQKARIIKKNTGLSEIFLSTEDDAVITEAADYTSEFNFTYTNNRRANIDLWSPKINPSREGIDEEANIAINNLYLSRMCSIHVFTLSSNWAHMVLHLSYVYHGFLPRYYSLDLELKDVTILL